MNILILRPGAIGDALLTFPVLAALRTTHQNPHITFVSNPAVIPLATAWRLAEQVYDFGDTRWSELFSPTGIRQPDSLALVQRANQVICWLRDDNGTVRRNLQAAGAKNIIIAPSKPPENGSIHIVDHLARTAGLQNVGGPLAHLTNKALPSPHRPIAIHPGSGAARKCWPAASFSAIIHALLRLDHHVLLLTGPAETERLQDVITALSRLSDRTTLASSTANERLLSSDRRNSCEVLENAPLLEVAKRLQQCKAYLGNDSGITHLAALLGIPTLALFGPSNPATWRPIGPRVEVIREQPLAALPVERVFDALLRMVM